MTWNEQPTATRQVGRWIVGALVVWSTAALISCGSDRSVTDSRSRDELSPQTQAELLEWAGFTDVSGLEILAVEEERGLDYAVDFVLRGSSADIDGALARADFDAEPEEGITIFQPPLPGFDLDDLTDPQSAEERWTNPSGDSIVRLAVRGATSEGDELLHVWAFTT